MTLQDLFYIHPWYFIKSEKEKYDFTYITNLNVLKAHQNIFSAMKPIDPTLKIITFQNETIDTIDQFPSSAAEYTSKFKDVHKDPKSSRVYISHKIESAISLGDIKYGNKQQLSNIFDTLVKNNT